MCVWYRRIQQDEWWPWIQTTVIPRHQSSPQPRRWAGCPSCLGIIWDEFGVVCWLLYIVKWHMAWSRNRAEDNMRTFIIYSVHSLNRNYQLWTHLSYDSHYTVKLMSCLDMILQAHIYLQFIAVIDILVIIHCYSFFLNYVFETVVCVLISSVASVSHICSVRRHSCDMLI
jgi:hypothetical protein